MQLEIDVEARDGYTIVVPHGEIDLATNGQLRETVNNLVVEGAVDLVVDLSDVSFLDSTGLGALIGARRRTHAFKGSFALVCADQQILRLFAITGLDKVFDIHESQDSALAEAG